MKNKVFLSVIIPVYNEARRIGNVMTVYHFLHKKRYRFEIIVVNDGSADGTAKRLTVLQKKIPFRILSYAKNRGKGYALIQGMLAACGRYRLFTDIDLSTPIQTASRFVRACQKADVVIGSRKTKGAVLLRRQSMIRECMGKVFTFLSRMVTGVPVSDFTCGFKCFSASSAQAIFSKMTIWRWGFDAELLCIAKQLGYIIEEVPVSWKNHPNSRVKIPEDIIRSFVDLLRITWRLRKGK